TSSTALAGSSAAALGTAGAGVVSGSGVRLFDPGARFDMIGVLFRTVEGTRAGQVAVTVRVSPDLVHWTRWVTLRAELSSGPSGSVQSRRDCVSEPAWVGAARYVQYTVSPQSGVEALRFACVRSRTAPLDGAAGDTATVAAGSPAVARLGMPVRPAIVTRAQWGAVESYRSDGPYYGEVRCAFVHHTVNVNGYTRKQAPALVRGIYYYHTHVNGWSDIGYNFLVDRFGRIYEGRYGGMTHAVIGAQVLGFNSWSTGVSVIGTYSKTRPSAAALAALEGLLAWKLDIHHVDPLAAAKILCSTGEKYRAGQWVTVPVILGHRDVNYTECPGNALYALLPTIRKAVAAIGNPKIFAPRVTPAPFSPNGDDVKDKATVAAGLSETADWTVTVKGAAGAVVRTMAGSGASVAAPWDGRDDSGARAPDGTYAIRIAATNADGAARSASTSVRLDTVPPPAPVLTLKATLISPNGDRIAEQARGTFALAQECRVRVLVRDGAGAVVRTLSGWSTLRAGGHAVVWDGRVAAGDSDAVVPDGPYTVVVQARDGAGNQAAARAALTIDTTLGHPVVTPAWFSPNADGVSDQTSLGFATTRSAKVTVEVRDAAGALVRRLSLGSLAAGSHDVAWDGRRDDGTTAASGRYACTATAVESIGTASLPFVTHVDLLRPVPAWASGSATVTLGKTLHAHYRVADRFSLKARVKIVAKAADGSTVAIWGPTWVATGTTLVRDFKPPTRGVYTLSLYAMDRAGNKQAHPASLAVTAK
ncbi:MAG TPA: FlgD immunoglobulin-like domain containing protein, partial [Thermoleophilia bacterium]|nr:FlgD immunoglobulin-like domain containing protein [Thermoleophilia bacterium]